MSPLNSRPRSKTLYLPAAIAFASGVGLLGMSCGGSGSASAPIVTPVVVPTPAPGAGGPGNFPHRFSAPYVQTWVDNNLVDLSTKAGNKWWTLAFVINGSGQTCAPTWNGDTGLTGNHYETYIDNLRSSLGG